MEIAAQRIILRDLESKDTANIFALSQDADVVEFMDYIQFKNGVEASAWVADKIKYNNEIPRSSYNFVIEDMVSKEFIGWIGIGQASDKNKGDLDFGYAIVKTKWGHGYATEALRTLIEMAWKETDASKIFGECRVKNLASAKVMKKAGMVKETLFSEDGNDSVRYSIQRPK